MTRKSLALIVCTLVLVHYSVNAQNSAPKKVAQSRSNQVYVKILLPTADAARDKNRPVVESWIAKEIGKPVAAKYNAVTPWVPIVDTGDPIEDPTLVWEGGCLVHAEITERKGGRIKLLLDGWLPFSTEMTVLLADEPGSRAIAAAEKARGKQGAPYVAVLVCPPPGRTAAINQKK